MPPTPQITKASIHYHFASKTELGMAVVDRYVDRFGDAPTAIALARAGTTCRWRTSPTA